MARYHFCCSVPFCFCLERLFLTLNLSAWQAGTTTNLGRRADLQRQLRCAPRIDSVHLAHGDDPAVDHLLCCTARVHARRGHHWRRKMRSGQAWLRVLVVVFINLIAISTIAVKATAQSLLLTVRADKPLGQVSPYVFGANYGPWSVVSPD